MDRSGVREPVLAAFRELAADYEARGGHRFPGALDHMDPSTPNGYPGTFAWSEADIQHRFASRLEGQFPGVDCVHLGLPLRRETRDDLAEGPNGSARRTHVDIVLSDLSDLDDLASDALRSDEFRRRRHEAFIEVKFFPKCSRRWYGARWRDFRDGVSADIKRLWEHATQPHDGDRMVGRCTYAAMLVVEDAGTCITRFDELYLGYTTGRKRKPAPLDRAWLDEVDVLLLGGPGRAQVLPISRRRVETGAGTTGMAGGDVSLRAAVTTKEPV